ncbi:porin family protein [Pedobacter polaris]|uniref:Porin family protein n=1 Tax=Pedobacter polaris TaxID=2571273 RepID=A0A4U1CVW9_9SPHI|nr:porin family protein [Pedobacter polaris]TKC12846.1 porin family protein [Pedobacter polaris]
MKRITLILTILFTSLGLFAQTNFYKISIGGGAGTTLAFADLNKKTLAFAGYGTLDYFITHYVNIGFEFQKGELAGGDITFDPNNRQFINSYISGTGNIKVQLGEFLTQYHLNNVILNNLRGLYAGVGFGYIKNKISNVRYYGENYYPGADKSVEGIVPINLGINFYFPDKWDHTRYAINLNLQNTIAIGEGLDGYGSSGAKHNDMYSYFSVGVRYHFGPFGLDKRR